MFNIVLPMDYQEIFKEDVSKRPYGLLVTSCESSQGVIRYRPNKLFERGLMG